MRALISGGTGYIGGRLAVHLSRAGHQITLGSRKISGSPSWLPDTKLVQTNWNEPDELSHICSDIDVVIHAAGMNAQECLADPVAALDFNGVATARFVAAAARAGVERFIYLSTVHVYASPLVGRISEETFPLNLHPYATSHLSGEHAVLAANYRQEIQGVVLRLSNAFGHPMSKEVNCWMLVINDLCRQAVQTHKLTLTGEVGQLRDFISIDDVCHIVGSFVNGENNDLHSGVFNVGSDRTRSVLSMAEIIQERCAIILGFRPEIKCNFKNERVLHPPLRYTSNRLSRLGFKASDGNIYEEIDHLIRFCARNFSSDSL